MQFCTNGRLNENSFKIALKPQNTLKQPSNNQASSVSIGSVPSTVTSTNPKTPSPRTHDVRWHAQINIDIRISLNYKNIFDIQFSYTFRMQKNTVMQLIRHAKKLSVI